jgi:PAS domain S-box-containing protein
MAQRPTYEELQKRIEELETKRKEANETYRSQRGLLNSLFNNLSLGITIWDSEGSLLMINKGFTDLTGYTLEDISCLDDWFLTVYPDPEYRHQVLADWHAAKNQADAVREFKVVCKNGGVKYIEFRGAFIEDGRALVSLADITERKQAQEENLKRQQFLESVLYHAPDAIVTLDQEQCVIDWNRGAVNMFGYLPEETIGVQLDDLVARGGHFAEARARTRQVLSGERVEGFETVRYRKDGTPLRVIAAGSPIIANNELTGVVAVYTDITDRVMAEAALSASEEKFRTLVEESPLGISLIGKDGRYRYTNPAFKSMFGYTLEDIPDGSHWFQKAFPDKAYRDNVIQTWTADLVQTPVGQSRARVFIVTCNDGSRKEIYFRRVTMENMDQFVIYEDITEKTKLERKFQQAQKFEAIGTLAGGIAHDFNNLLMGIHGRTSLMKTDLAPSHPHIEHLQAIEEYVRSAADLTKQLLGFARGGKYEVKAVDINELIIDSATMFGRTRKEIHIHTKMHPMPLVVEVDRSQIEQVLLNIYVNAWQAMPSGGNLFLETKPSELDDAYASPNEAMPGYYAKVSITDTGIGMDGETRLRIFDPFFTTKEKGRGTGLGLASVYGIIKNHGGFITVYSEVGHGTTFNFYLPLSDKQVTCEAPIEGRLTKGTGTVLLVDDEEMIVAVGQAMLQKLGYHVITANSGKEAINLLENMGGKVDLVILDMIMPGMDGGKTFDRIREIQPQMRVLLSSGYALNGQANAILNRGCNGFIQKPYDIFELSAKVRALIDS